MNHRITPLSALFPLLSLLLAACTSPDSEAFGRGRRQRVTDRALAVRDVQQSCGRELREALTALGDAARPDETRWEHRYRRLAGEYEDCARCTDELGRRIGALDLAARDWFAEWERDAAELSSAELRSQSEQRSADARRRLDELLAAAREAEAALRAALAELRDRVLFMKHDSSAEALASLERERESIGKRFDEALRDLDTSIAAAGTFAASVGGD